MRVLVTGARGFVGRNLCCALKNIRDGKDRRAKYRALLPLEVMEYDIDSVPEELDGYCSRADFVFNFAGVNRPEDQSEFMEGNFGFASTLLDTLERHGNTCPVMLSSSAQASLSGRFEGSVYGESKLAGEGLFREYSERTGAPVLIYRFPNLYGKWCRPRYNSAVATFCDVLASIYFSPFSPTYFRQSRQRGCAGFANADAPLSASRLPPPSRPHRRWIRPSGGTTVPLS